MSQNNNDTIPLRSRALHRFYEPLVLLKSLNYEMRDTAEYNVSEEDFDPSDPSSLLRATIYKLGHACDSVKGEGARTMTSFVIQQELNGTIHYLFTSNGRSPEEFEHTKTYVMKLLQKVGAMSDKTQLGPPFYGILSAIVEFNEYRVNYYLRELSRSASLCQEKLQDHLDEADSRKTDNRLTKMIEWVNVIDSTKATGQFKNGCSKFILRLERLQSSSVGRRIQERAKHGRMRVSKEGCWSNLQHMISRLVAYSQTTQFLLAAKTRWPQLFQSFEVSFFLSSQSLPAPARNKSGTAESIVGRMTSKEKDMKIFKNFVRDLQMFNLDESIRTHYRSDSFRPIVHSDVLLLHELDKMGRLKPEYFFNNDMFIGTSKPPCKLCQYYFEEHRTNVGLRPTHGNIYLNWRFPDVLRSEIGEGDKKREIMLNRVLFRVRKDAFNIVKKRIPSSYKDEDSHTYSAAMPISRRASVCSNSSLGDFNSLLGSLSLGQ